MIKFAKLRKLTNNRMTSKAREQQKSFFFHFHYNLTN